MSSIRSFTPSIAVSGFLGVLAGSLLTVLLRQTPDAEVSAAIPVPVPDRMQGDLSERLSGITAELESIRMLLQRMDARGERPTSLRTAADGPEGEGPPAEPELRAMLEQAIAAMRRTSVGVPASPSLVLPIAPASLSHRSRPLTPRIRTSSSS